MNLKFILTIVFLIVVSSCTAQIGTRFPSEKKEVIDPVTGAKLIFLTSTSAGDSKIYQTHNQWTSDGNWLIFRSRRVHHEAMAVNEKSGVIVQVTEGGYRGMLCVARKSMKLFFMRSSQGQSKDIIEVDLAALFADSESGNLKPESKYQRVCGTIPSEYRARGDMTLDAEEEWVWFTVGKK
jgi:oligogalacturonide lyase